MERKESKYSAVYNCTLYDCETIKEPDAPVSGGDIDKRPFAHSRLLYPIGLMNQRQVMTDESQRRGTVGCVLNCQNGGSCKSGVFYNIEVIFGSVMYFYMINCLTLVEMSNFESHILNLICIQTA